MPPLLLVAAAAAAAQGATGPAIDATDGCPPECAAAEPRYEGEYGLWVSESRGRLQVNWLTREPAGGVLRVHAGDRVIHRATTRAGGSHASRFRLPRADSIVLEYGARDDPADLHRTVIALRPPNRSPPVFTGVDSLYVVGDVHGQYDDLIRLLRNARVVDDQLRWGAGRGHLVLLGDIFDRGADVTRILWFLYRLEREAEHTGGRVHVVLGNHEIMVFLNDLRYVAPKENLIAFRHGTDYRKMYDIRESILGRWLASKPAALRVNDVLLAHGGVTADYLAYTLESVDDTLAAFLGEDLFYHWSDPAVLAGVDSAAVARRDDFFWDENSLFWYRGYVQTDTAGANLARVLRRFDGDLHVVAHTPRETIQARYDGALIAVHPRRPATELLLLVWTPEGRRPYRYTLSGPPAPL